MPEARNCDIAIVGGGMVGASLALLLARSLPALSIRLLESNAFPGVGEAPVQPSFDRRNTALSPSSAQLFNDLGVWPALESQASPIRQIQVSDRGHFGFARFGPEDNGGEPLGYVVPNAVIGHGLLQRVEATPAVKALAPVDVLSLKPIQDGMAIHMNDRQQPLVARLVILADGAGSPLAQSLGVGSHARDYGQCAIIANVGYQRPHRGRAFERFTRDGPLALLPLLDAGGRAEGSCESALVWTQPIARLDEVRAWSSARFLSELQQAFGFRLGWFTQVGVRSVYPLKLHLAEEQVRSSLVLMGNAAHSLHPVAGQGFNLALRDAARLTQTLSRGVMANRSPGDLKLLEEYERAQQRDQQVTVGLSDSFIRIFASEQPAVVAGRNFGLLSLEMFGGWRESFLSHMAGRAQPRARLDL